MGRTLFFSLLTCFLIGFNLRASEKDSLLFQSQLSLSGLYNPHASVPGLVQARLLPQLDYLRDFSGDRRISAEVSANLLLKADAASSSLKMGASMGLYRAWLRFSSQRNEIRAGLQQLNFGSASLLRPLQWFDGLNPTDPLRMTNGVWGILDRLYFENNATLWLWGLYGNTERRIWDLAVQSVNVPEFGFRFQQPVSSGEMALSLHHRTVETTLGTYSRFRETKIGLDGKWDIGPGLWFEDSFTATSQASPFKSGWNFLTVGADLTPEFLDGVSFTFEHMLNNTYSTDAQMSSSANFSALSATWPINMINRLSGIVLYSWEGDAWFRYLTWSADFDRTSVHLIGFWNPNLTATPMSIGSGSFARYGVQFLYVLHL